ncbi:LacI family transcriptional regulator [Streptomyces sp. 2132.2]|uniref:LacI family DNA-binding transcriptional regulator n=1 Tax=Streptomyces sp. 2132.2 TaxID=2485161 RepID=UPI000F49E6A2|nr:LacI family DNA-binding transcriptional regulator [Streptomyces sp. 2132.2]ROQ97879.1 LacI family transcriptional regulator [Streptomyces sp. 2132.2]
MSGRGRSGGRPTLEEVAARAGVGRGTVSRVVNGASGVSARTRAAVEAAVEELGYVPNRAARALASNRADAVALVVPEPQSRFFAEPYFSDMVRGVGAALAETDVQLVLTLAGSDRERRRLARYLAAHRVDGVLLVGVHAEDPLPELLAGLGIPAVVSGRRSAAEPLPYVDCDNLAGAAGAVGHLLDRGRRAVATVTGPLDITEEGGRRAMRELLERRPDLDAVFAASDVMALGARRELRAAGRLIPGDVALVGFDDSVAARHMEPPLTSVRQPVEEMGRAMARILLSGLAGEPGDEAVVLPTELVVRESS